MATFTWYLYMGTTPTWVDIGANTVVFSGSATDLSAPITVAAWQDGTHAGNGDPGTDQCGSNHANNVKYISSTQFDSGGGTETLNDTNLAQTECTLRINFADAASVATSAARFYLYDEGVGVTTEAIELEAYAFEHGQSATTWTQINDDSGSIGGDNSGERLDLADQAASTSHDYYIAISVSPETVGAKAASSMGVNLTYS